MCMYDNCDEIVTMLAEGWHKARKTHKCFECRREVAPGERYHFDRFVFEGQLTNHKTCAHCMVVRDWLQDECGGFVFKMVEEDAREHVSASPGYYGIDLVRCVVGMHWKWRTPSGRLLAVPAAPRTSEQMKAARLLEGR